jgi:hypothetical protein
VRLTLTLLAIAVVWSGFILWTVHKLWRKPADPIAAGIIRRQSLCVTLLTPDEFNASNITQIG